MEAVSKQEILDNLKEHGVQSFTQFFIFTHSRKRLTVSISTNGGDTTHKYYPKSRRDRRKFNRQQRVAKRRDARELKELLEIEKR